MRFDFSECLDLRWRLISAGWFLTLAASCLLPGSGMAQQISQELTLRPGWNAIYLRVTPVLDAGEFFGNWPVPSVSVYNSRGLLLAGRDFDGSGGEAEVGNPFLIWTREAQGVSSLGRTVPGDSVLVCFSTNSATVKFSVSGTPAAPRIAWHKTEESGSLNYVPVSLALGKRVRLSDYFEGRSFSRVCRLTGEKESSPSVVTIMSGVETMASDGEVFLLDSQSVSDWSGVLNVSPQTGVNFGEDRSLSAFSVRNDGTAPRTVSVSYGPSRALTMAKPVVQYLDTTISGASEWKEWKDGEALSRELDPGEKWEITLALDRSQFPESEELSDVGGILTIVESGASGMMAEIPLKAVNKSWSSKWPQGLWIGTASLKNVDRVVTGTDGSGSSVKSLLPAGGTFKFRFLLHVDDTGLCRLLQRVTLAGAISEDGTLTPALYPGEVDIPATSSVYVRYSSLVFPVDVPVILPSERSSGGFGASGASGSPPEGGLVYEFTVSERSNSNPFYHPFHPEHDGLDWDFDTSDPLPDGRNFENYAGSVKPETFSFDNQFVLQWDTDSSSWNPTENVSGKCFFGLGNRDGSGGLRHEGAIWASGTFTMDRVIDLSSLVLY